MSGITTGCGTTQYVSTKRCAPARTSNVSTEIVGARPERSHRVITFQDHDAEGNQNQNFPLAEKFGGRSTSHTASVRLAGSRNHGVARPYSTNPTEIECLPLFVPLQMWTAVIPNPNRPKASSPLTGTFAGNPYQNNIRSSANLTSQPTHLE